MTDDARHRQGNCVLNPLEVGIPFTANRQTVGPSFSLFRLSPRRQSHLPFHYLNRLGL